MLDNINNKNKKLGLAERTQPSATEILPPHGIPTGKAMPDYTRTHTSSQPIYFNPAEQGLQIREQDMALRKLLSATPEECRLLFEDFQKRYETEIYHHITQLMLWAATTEHINDAPLSMTDYDSRIREEQKKLKILDDALPVEKYFRNGSDDTAKCGHLFIIKIMLWNEALQIYAIELLSGIQWLLHEKEKLTTATNSSVDDSKEETIMAPKQKENTFEEAFKRLLISYLHLDQKGTNTKIEGKTWNKTRLLVAVMQVLEYRETLPTCDETEFAALVAPMIGQDPSNLRKNINHNLQDIKPYGRNLKELDEDYIKENPLEDGKGLSPREFRERWKGMFKMIDDYIEQEEDLAPLRQKNTNNSERNPQ